MSGDLQAKRKSKNRSKKKSQLQELEKKEHFQEALLNFADEDDDVDERRRPQSNLQKNKVSLVLFILNNFNWLFNRKNFTVKEL